MKNFRKKLIQFLPVIIAVICIAGCTGQSAETKLVIAKFGEEEIYLEEIQFYLIINQVDYEKEYAKQYPDQNIWELDVLGTGNTLEDDVKQSILQEIKKMHILLNKAEEFGITTDEKDEEELMILEEIMKDRYSEEVLQEIHMEDGVVQERLRQSMLAAKVKEVICEENGWTTDDREEKFQALYKEWAEETSFTIRELEWAEVHFEQGKYKIKEETESK